MYTPEQIQSIVRQFTDRDVAPDESLFTTGLLDSFSLPDLVTALEEQLRIKIPDSDLNPRTFDSVELIVGYLNRKA
jgi:acyl carrier protein